MDNKKTCELCGKYYITNKCNECYNNINNDTTLINRLWWLRKFLNRDFDGKSYDEINDDGLSTDVCKEVDEIVEHIKTNY